MLITNLLGRRLLDSTGKSSGECVGITDNGNGETVIILCDNGSIQFQSLLEVVFDMSAPGAKPQRKTGGNKL
jgi:hypothetical protein